MMKIVQILFTELKDDICIDVAISVIHDEIISLKLFPSNLDYFIKIPMNKCS